MKKALIILNGIRFPYKLVDRAIEWSKTNGSSLHAIFVKAEDEVKEGYIFPSDLDAAKKLSTTQDSENASIKVIESQIKLLHDRSVFQNVPFTYELLTDPPLDEIISKAKSAQMMFLDGNDEGVGTLSVNTFKMADLKAHSPCAVEVVG